MSETSAHHGSPHGAAQAAPHGPHQAAPHAVPHGPDEDGPRRPWTVLAVALAAQILVVLDISVVNTALPSIGRVAAPRRRPASSGSSRPT